MVENQIAIQAKKAVYQQAQERAMGGRQTQRKIIEFTDNGELQVQHLINNRPGKIRGYLTPNEVFGNI